MGFIVRELAIGAKRDRIPLGIFVVVWIIGAIALTSKEINPIRTSSYVSNLEYYAIFLAVFLALIAIWEIYRERPDSPVRFLRERFVEENWPRRLVTNIPMILALAIFMPMFSALKSAIPLFNDFTWDQTFIDWDIAIHGTDPWKILHPVLGHAPITFALSLLYQVWLFLIYIGSLYFAFFSRNEGLRQQYFISYFLIWSLLGILAAHYFASVGPCFMLVLRGDPHFNGLMDYLHITHEDYTLISINIQEILIRAYHVKNYELGSGITAMPSMHVALAFLVFLGMRSLGKARAWVFGIYALIILIASVHLGFHYAVDGYASIAATALIWWVAGLVARRSEATAPGGVDETATASVPMPGEAR